MQRSSRSIRSYVRIKNRSRAKTLFCLLSPHTTTIRQTVAAALKQVAKSHFAISVSLVYLLIFPSSPWLAILGVWIERAVTTTDNVNADGLLVVQTSRVLFKSA
ncbi:uncharacterized protein K452DRAFT_15827 [Aplosporella prunicola CBS 121167]|uniref:Uncharacterized protein n=1 Tax=Aplosporella prunicola CBS 121167 TaxID=1176127 RepID=A0A6A6AV37_9PEZI|nr:uncharacterized protein K452DRAFT_15827 [Aplosporella prunicola CBS 121167]KAF2135530.1 hypothetical protein K452DRAFT_15827 [Aplosporella prunicola CBS 121167]